MQRSNWLSPPTTKRSRPSKESSCYGWPACCGGCDELPPSKAVSSRSRQNKSCSFVNDALLKIVRTWSEVCVVTTLRLKSCNKTSTNQAVLLATFHYRLAPHQLSTI